LTALRQGVYPWQEQQQKCDAIRKQPTLIPGATIFPEETYPPISKSSYGVNIPRDEIKRAAALNNDNRKILLFVYGCIDYALTTDPTRHRQTGFILSVTRIPGGFVAIDDTDIPASELHLLPASPMSRASYAD
jgi:hypothetical protein